MRSRIVIYFWILGSILLFAGGCGQPEAPAPPDESPAKPMEISTDEPVAGDWLIRAIRAEPSTLNPIVATDYSEMILNEFVYEQLVKRNPRTMRFEPVLAERWEESEDHLVYTFYLRKGINWHNGEPFTTDDIRYSFERIRDPAVRAPHIRNYYKDVEKMEVLDEYTVRFTMSKVYALALEKLGEIPFVCRAVFDDGQDFNQHPAGRTPVGTGPYKFKQWQTGQEIVLERNPDYWGTTIGRNGYLDRIVFRIVPDPHTALEMAKAGELDMVTDLLPEQWVRQLSSKTITENYNKFKFFTPQYSYIGWNSQRPFFSDKRVRRAMTHLFDRERFKEKVQYGLAEVVSGNFFFQSPYYDNSIKPWPYDPAEAVRLLDEAGWTDHDGDGIRDKDGIPFKFTFLLPSASVNGEKVATLLKEELEKVGIQMDIQKMEWALYSDRVHEKNFDAVTQRWMMPWSVDIYQVWHSSSAGPNGSNYVSFKNPETDEIAEQLRQTFDEQERIRLCHRFHRILHEEQPYTFSHCTNDLMIVNKRFQNVNTYRILPGFDLSEWWVPKPLQRYP